MTNINTFKIYYEYLCYKVVDGGTMPEIDFDNNCNMAQLQKLSLDYETFVKTGVVSNYLQTFLKTNVVRQVNPNNPLVPYPTDMQYPSSVGHLYKGKQYDCELIDNVNWREINVPNGLNQATLRFVKYQQTGAGFMFAPANTGVVYIDYFKTPIVPHWGSTEVNGILVYDPNTSINFEWDNFAINEVMSIFLKIAGVAIKDADISQFSAEFAKETNLTV